MSGAERPDIVIFSTADWLTRYWTNKQHTAVALAARGHRVLYVETVGIRQPNLGSGRDWRRLATRLLAGVVDLFGGPRMVRPQLWVMSPLALPWRRLAVVRGLNRALLRWPLLRFLQRAGFAYPEVWTYHPFLLDALHGFNHGSLSYHCVDDIATVPGVDAAGFATAEQRLLAVSDAVFVTARALEQHCRRYSANVNFFPNVVDAEHFGTAFSAQPEPADLGPIGRPRLGYHGVLSDYKVDVDLLRALAAEQPDWQLVLIGDEREGQSGNVFAALRQLPNVHFLGGKDYRQLPAYLGGFDVGLLPMRRNAYTASMYPMKYHEYLAAGVPVASTDLPFVSDAGGFLEVGDDAEGFAAAISRQLARGRLSSAEAAAAVGENTWEQRLDKLLAITSRVVPPEAEERA